MLAYGGGERGGGVGQQPAVAVSVSLVPAKMYVSPSAKAAAEGPDDVPVTVPVSVPDSAAEVPGTVKSNGAGADADTSAKSSSTEPDG